jgi:copper chaperone
MKKILIEGMSCAHCTAHVKDALSKLSGVTKVKEINLAGKYALIEGTADDASIKAAIEEEGYDVVGIQG